MNLPLIDWFIISKTKYYSSYIDLFEGSYQDKYLMNEESHSAVEPPSEREQLSMADIEAALET